MAGRRGEVINSSLYAHFTVNQGISASEGLKLFRAAGGQIGNQRWYAMVSAFRQTREIRQAEMSRSVNAIPQGEEIKVWNNLTKKGYYQMANVLTRVKATGELKVVPYARISTSLASRRSVIEEALGHVLAGITEGKYEEEIIGAVYTGTYTGGSRG